LIIIVIIDEKVLKVSIFPRRIPYITVYGRHSLHQNQANATECNDQGV